MDDNSQFIKLSSLVQLQNMKLEETSRHIIELHQAIDELIDILFGKTVK